MAKAAVEACSARCLTRLPVPKLQSLAPKPTVDKATLLRNLGSRAVHLAVGVDRADYTKGILERFRGVELLVRARDDGRRRHHVGGAARDVEHVRIRYGGVWGPVALKSVAAQSWRRTASDLEASEPR